MLALATLLVFVPSPAGAQAQAPTTVPAPAGVIDVVEVSGRIDPVVSDFIRQAIASAAASRSEVLVIQLDSSGVLISRSAFAALVARIKASTVPVAV